MGCVGTIAAGFRGPFDGSVLYTKDELFAPQQKYNSGENGGAQLKNTFSPARLKKSVG